MSVRSVVSLLCFLLSFSLSAQQQVVAPLDIPLYLSGGFGELRSNHFHSGVDFKTQGKTGLPIRAVKDGYIYRIFVSPYGYGRAVYIDHQDGTSSVYGHLDAFVRPVHQAVLDSQYMQESFRVDLHFTPEQFPVKRGEVFAYGGNTGSSGGPHLHFELRETDGDIPFDPLPYFKDKIKDTRPPDIRGLMILPIDYKGIVNGSAEKQVIPLEKDKSGHPAVNKSISAWGDIGIAIKAYDRMNDTNNIYGVREIILKVDGDTVYHALMDRFSFDDTRYLNAYIDYEDWIENKSFYMKSYTEPGNYLGINQCLDNGVVNIDQERLYRFEYELRDIYGNKSTLRFEITGKAAAIPQPPSHDTIFYYNKANYYSDKGIELSIPRRQLYSNQYVAIDTLWNEQASTYSPLYRIGKRIPLHDYCSLSLDIANDVHLQKEQYGVVQVFNGKKTWLGGDYDNGRIDTRIRELGDFIVSIDTTPPVITPQREAKWTIDKKISFKISDNLSGIQSYRATLDGRFILFEYDAKTNSLFHLFDSRRTPPGTGTLHLTVTDAVGNTSEYTTQVIF